MKVQEKQQARKLRTEGWSINQIYQKLGVAKSSVSLWVQDITLSPEQLTELARRGHQRNVIEKRRHTRLMRENARRQIIIDSAKDEIKNISKIGLFLIGIALYWAEGSKTKRGVAELSNADPELIKVAMKFFRNICKVQESRFRGHIFLHPHLDHEKAEKYWSGITNIPVSQFFKTTMQQSHSSKKKRDTLPYGTFSIVVCDTELFLRIKGWTQGVYTVLHNKKNRR